MSSVYESPSSKFLVCGNDVALDHLCQRRCPGRVPAKDDEHNCMNIVSTKMAISAKLKKAWLSREEASPQDAEQKGGNFLENLDTAFSHGELLGQGQVVWGAGLLEGDVGQPGRAFPGGETGGVRAAACVCWRPCSGAPQVQALLLLEQISVGSIGSSGVSLAKEHVASMAELCGDSVHNAYRFWANCSDILWMAASQSRVGPIKIIRPLKHKPDSQMGLTRLHWEGHPVWDII